MSLVLESPGIYLESFFATCDERFAMDCTVTLRINRVSNYCLSVYLNIAELQHSPGKHFRGHGKSSNFL